MTYDDHAYHETEDDGCGQHHPDCWCSPTSGDLCTHDLQAEARREYDAQVQAQREAALASAVREGSGLGLVEFLTARLDEDEIDAQNGNHAHEGRPWQARLQPAGPQGHQDVFVSVESAEDWPEEVAAKRAILASHNPYPDRAVWRDRVDPDQSQPACSTCGYPEEYPTRWPCSTVRHLAAPYAGHPDYRQEWAP